MEFSARLYWITYTVYPIEGHTCSSIEGQRSWPLDPESHQWQLSRGQMHPVTTCCMDRIQWELDRIQVNQSVGGVEDCTVCSDRVSLTHTACDTVQGLLRWGL